MWSSDYKATTAVTLPIRWVAFSFYLCFSPGTHDSLWLPCSKVLNALQNTGGKSNCAEKRKPYHKLYIFGHKSEGFKVFSPLTPLLLSWPPFLPSAHFLPVGFSPSLWLSSVSPVSFSELKLLFIPLLWSISRIFLSNLHFNFPFCELNRLRSTCWCQMHCLSDVSAINS